MKITPTTIIDNLVQQLSLSSTLGVTTIIEYISSADLDETLNPIFISLNDIEANDSLSSDLHKSIRDTRSSLYILSEDLKPELGEIYKFKVSDESIPAITISANIYGTSEKEQEIINNNGIQNPFFSGDNLNLIFSDG